VKIILSAIEDDLLKAFKHHFAGIEDVEITDQSIVDLDCDAYVSPANSFGFMDGGVDQVYVDKWGWELQERVRHRIKHDFLGEMPVGQSLVVAINSDHWLIVSPTMRVPMALPEDTIAPYLSTRAAVSKAKCYYDMETLAFPGMGSGIGGVDPFKCAAQMRMGIRHGLDRAPQPSDWLAAKRMHDRLVNLR